MKPGEFPIKGEPRILGSHAGGVDLLHFLEQSSAGGSLSTSGTLGVDLVDPPVGRSLSPAEGRCYHLQLWYAAWENNVVFPSYWQHAPGKSFLSSEKRKLIG